MSDATGKLYFRLSANLTDGSSPAICDNVRDVMQSVESWCDEFQEAEGESFSVRVVRMTDAEVEALPEL